VGTRLTSLGAGALVIALILAGCGGDDSSSSTTSISKDEFIAKADAICQKGTKRMEAGLVGFLTNKGGKIRKPSQEDSEEFIVTVLTPSLRREIKVEALIAALEEGLDTAEDDPEAVAAGSTDIVFGIASRLAGEYGIETCGSR
jgi:hypothetical protein